MDPMTLLTIPHGYRLRAGADPRDFLDRLAAVMNPVRDRLDAEHFIELAVHAVDRADLSGQPRPSAPMDDAYAAWEAEQEAMNPNYVWFDPHSLAVRIGFDPVSGRHLIILATDCPEYIQAMDGLTDAGHYGYLAVIEELPDNVSTADWQERAQAWTRMLPRGRADAMDLWHLRGPSDTRTRQVVSAVQSCDELARAFNTSTPMKRSRNLAVERYADWLITHQGLDPMSAVMDARLVGLMTLQGVILHRLAPFSAQLLADGTGRHPEGLNLGREAWDDLCCREHRALAAEDLVLHGSKAVSRPHTDQA